MSQRVFVLLGAMPIPVGHRVEVYILSRDVGVFGTDIQPQPDEPLVRDLETGVYYGRTWQMKPLTHGALSITAPRSSEPADGVAVVETMQGRVAACLVLSDGVHDKQAAQTTLAIELAGSVAVG